MADKKIKPRERTQVQFTDLAGKDVAGKIVPMHTALAEKMAKSGKVCEPGKYKPAEADTQTDVQL